MRLGDLLIALVLLTITGPLIALAVLAIKCRSPGPAFERFEGGASGARRLTLLKLRTRAHGPVAASAREASAVGRFLEYARIDELPQLIHLLRGELGLLDHRRPAFPQ